MKMHNKTDAIQISARWTQHIPAKITNGNWHHIFRFGKVLAELRLLLPK